MRRVENDSAAEPWPALPPDGPAAYGTLHMYAQIVGKVRLALAPRVNHWWSVALYVAPRGLTTSAIPAPFGSFEVLFDFIDHELVIETSRGGRRALPLGPRAVADFYPEVMAALRSLGIDVRIWKMPTEVPEPIPFDADRRPAVYDRESVHRLWRALVSMENVFQRFRARFIGKCSPVHFFWGSFDLAVTRFSGRRAPEREGGDSITREAYSHEVISTGFWPGGGAISGPAFYAYAAPEPSGFATASVRPGKAFYHPELKGFALMYDDVRRAPSPEEPLMDFLESTYEAGARLAGWDRGSLERLPEPASR